MRIHIYIYVYIYIYMIYIWMPLFQSPPPQPTTAMQLAHVNKHFALTIFLGGYRRKVNYMCIMCIKCSWLMSIRILS